MPIKLVALVAMLAAGPASSGRPLKLSRIPHISQEATRGENEPLAAYLSKRLGQKVVLDIPKNYDAVIEQLARGEVDIAILAPLTYVVAKKRMPELVVIAQLVAEGSGQYWSYIVTAADGPIQTLPQLGGKRFAFVDRRSTSGYLLPLGMLHAADVKIGRASFAGSHPDAVDLVLRHKVDAGAIASTTFGHMRDAKLNERLRILAKSDPVPFDAVVVQPNLPKDVVTRLRTTLLELSSRTEEGRAVLQGHTLSNGFVDATAAHYDGVRRTLEKVGLAP
jgi:phosphonate transport system substrate-binding protein